MLLPNTKAPDLDLNLIGGETISLKDLGPEKFTMLVFYRGHHCPVCKKYLKDLNSRLEDFEKVGVTEIYAISGDEQERAKKSVEEWGLDKLRVAYKQTVASMKEWGLYISTAIKDGEPDVFGEPGVFLIKPDQTIYYIGVNSMPFARPPFDELNKAIQFINENDYPSRGRGV